MPNLIIKTICDPQFVAKLMGLFSIVGPQRMIFFLKSADHVSRAYSLTLIHLSSDGNAVFVAIGYR